jgi:crotonobetainyl-CoA:carnitine CoA-transferase CaiB-like acyl-CoA transferase
VPLEHESFENLMTINSPFRIEEEEKVEFSRAPKVGEHTKEVLKEMGFKDTDLEELKNNKSIFWSDI